ncbi:DUF2332 domain-containing protein [Streptomyces sp. NL15-2K]|uniref:DUF2332 domain-containing protein n=1 Tax=Streptomyces sp. NL15-2K TaxID=376149 RepID=UPI000F56D405|nr:MULTISPECIES: DUF2332 domain-containing protein [Actinomycetes]WKX15892.1 DUF2332 domain-containing protein [Kutzneria buriramensis]GCB53124.1 hypothetical protein SNL152K_10481 [Streptomyces sp. NL15-2K]
MRSQGSSTPTPDIDLGTIAHEYRLFAERQAKGHSPVYEALSVAVAGDERLLALLHTLPPVKRQPNLLLAAARRLGVPLDSTSEFLTWVVTHWDELSSLMLVRLTQTNESARCATLLPVLATLPQPLALIEVGASAGLCLYPDRYRYIYDQSQPFGPADSPVIFPCRTTGPVPIPRQLPDVVWRTGVDLNPLDPSDPEDTSWLESLVWPDQTERLQRLRGALNVARAEPAHIVRGDLNEAVSRLVAQAPTGATPVVFHSAVLAYLSPDARAQFARTMRNLPCRWISNESPSVFPALLDLLPEPAPTDRATFVMALDERPIAFTGPHGERLHWLSDAGLPVSGE